MKKLFYTFFALIFVSMNVSATNYYVKSGGNDEADGLSDETAWGTLQKVNDSQGIFVTGDSVLFKRGDIFHGYFEIGGGLTTEGAKVVYGAYGTGEKPVITGFETLTSWTDVGDGVYSKEVECQVSPNFITINNQWYAMGRFPNDEWLTYESAETNVSITDNELTADPVWTGAEAVIKKTSDAIDRCRPNIGIH